MSETQMSDELYDVFIWLQEDWPWACKSIHTDGAGVLHVSWRGVVPESVRERLRAPIEREVLRLSVVQPASLMYAVRRVERVLELKRAEADVDVFKSEDWTDDFGKLCIAFSGDEEAVKAAVVEVAKDFRVAARPPVKDPNP